MTLNQHIGACERGQPLDRFQESRLSLRPQRRLVETEKHRGVERNGERGTDGGDGVDVSAGVLPTA